MSNERVEAFGSEDTLRGRYLIFPLGREVFGIEIRHVTEIIGIQPIARLPQAPEYLRGVINLRGNIIPVIDVRIRFHKESVGYTDRTCIIVVNVADITVGLIVDNVSEVLSIEDENISPPPCDQSGVRNGFIKGIGKVNEAIRLLIDCEKLLLDDHGLAKLSMEYQ